MRTKFLTFPIMLLATFGLACLVIGQDEGDAASDAATANDFKTIKAEYDAAYKEFLSAYRSEKDAAKKREMVANMPTMDSYADQVFGIAEAAEEDFDAKESAAALSWLIGGARDEANRSKATELMLENHMDSDQIGAIASTLARSAPSEETENTLRMIIEKSPHKDVRGKTTYSLVQYLGNFEALFENEERLEMMSNRYGKEVVDYVKSKSAESVKADVAELIKSITTDYADVKLRGSKTLGQTVEAVIFEKERLQIGMEVPEIEGEDIDGKVFKLSDYRGKVVVIDFWGDW